MTVHSTQLGKGASLSVAVHTLYTVPTGKRTIWKGLTLYNHGGGTNRVVVQAVMGGTTVVVADPILAAAGAANDTLQLNLWIVLNAGDEIQVAPQTSATDASASGAELTL